MRRFYLMLMVGAALAEAAVLNPASAQQKAADKAPAVMVLKGAPIGGVKFAHAEHEKRTKCVTCHHASVPAKPLTSPHQQCADCHTRQAAPPMKTTIRDAYHNALAKKGTCVDCHTTEAAAGKAAPAKCVSCHKKENV